MCPLDREIKEITLKACHIISVLGLDLYCGIDDVMFKANNFDFVIY